MALNLGGIIRLTYNVKNSAGTLVNPTTATLTIVQPDGTTAAGTTVTLPPSVTGVLVVDFTPTQAGLHSAHWATTIPTTSDDDVFTAERAASMLVSVDEAVAHLRSANITTSDADREQLQWFCLAATDAVERDLNRVVVRRTVGPELHDGNTMEIHLRQHPIISITTVIESGVTLTAADYFLSSSTGMLYRGTGTVGLWWGYGRQNISVTYVAGYADPPRSIREVALGAVQELWQTSQQAAHPLINEDVELAVAAAVSALTGPLRGAYNRLRVSGVA